MSKVEILQEPNTPNAARARDFCDSREVSP